MDLENTTADQATAATLRAEALPLRELSRPYDAQQILRDDLVAPPQTLLESSGYDLGTEPLDIGRYIDADFYDRENRKLWPKVWQFAVWGYDIPNPGDTTVYRNVDRSVILVRQRDGSIKGFVNSCLHRGREICSGSGRRAQLRCPYHGFTWSLEGSLSWVPAEWDFPQIVPEKFALPQVRVDEWNGFVFINFDADAPSLVEYMGGMTAQWESWDFHKRYKAVHVEKIVRCNWKVCLDGFIETLHVYASHPQIAKMAPESATQYDVYPGEPNFSRFHSLIGMPSAVLRKQPTEQEIVDSYTSSYVPEVHDTEFGRLKDGETARQAIARIARRVYKERLGVDVDNTPEAELVDGTEYMLFPNFVPWPSIGNPIVYRFRPGSGPDECVWDTMIFLPFEGDRPPSASVIRLGAHESLADVPELGYLDFILDQDATQLPLVQQGLKSSATGVVQLSRYQEARIRHYNQTLDRYLDA